MMFWFLAAQVVFTFTIFYMVVTRHDNNGDFVVAGIIAASIISSIQIALFTGDVWWSLILGYAITVFDTLVLVALWKEGRALQELASSVSSSRKRSSGVEPFTPRGGVKLDIVRFNYINKKDEYSTRRVKVQRVSENTFKGIDLDKVEQRTFLYNSVIGEITSEETGEIFSSAEEWRDSIR